MEGRSQGFVKTQWKGFDSAMLCFVQWKDEALPPLYLPQSSHNRPFFNGMMIFMLNENNKTSVKVSECQGCIYCLEEDCPYELWDYDPNIEILEDYCSSVL